MYEFYRFLSIGSFLAKTGKPHFPFPLPHFHPVIGIHADDHQWRGSEEEGTQRMRRKICNWRGVLAGKDPFERNLKNLDTIFEINSFKCNFFWKPKKWRMFLKFSFSYFILWINNSFFRYFLKLGKNNYYLDLIINDGANLILLLNINWSNQISHLQ